MVVDNTNVDAVSRKRYIDVAKRLHAPVRAFLMDVTLEHAMHNELVRPTIQKRERERRGDSTLSLNSLHVVLKLLYYSYPRT